MPSTPTIAAAAAHPEDAFKKAQRRSAHRSSYSTRVCSVEGHGNRRPRRRAGRRRAQPLPTWHDACHRRGCERAQHAILWGGPALREFFSCASYRTESGTVWTVPLSARDDALFPSKIHYLVIRLSLVIHTRTNACVVEPAHERQVARTAHQTHEAWCPRRTATLHKDAELPTGHF